MGYYRKWKPSKKAAREFADKMKEISEFCSENGIYQSCGGDSYYFTVDGKEYRVSNHSVKKSNAAAFDELTGEQLRRIYHEDGRKADVTYIHASKTRIIDIFTDIKNGYKLDGRGYRV